MDVKTRDYSGIDLVAQFLVMSCTFMPANSYLNVFCDMWCNIDEAEYKQLKCLLVEFRALRSPRQLAVLWLLQSARHHTSHEAQVNCVTPSWRVHNPYAVAWCKELSFSSAFKRMCFIPRFQHPWYASYCREQLERRSSAMMPSEGGHHQKRRIGRQTWRWIKISF